jgi:endonuclease/exonuclease/phosphatase family metal-dependent hydrolase
MTASFENPFGPLIETTVRVMSWNLWWRFGSWEQRQSAILEWLRRVDADVIALQEVWAEDEVCQADIFADSLGMNAVYDNLWVLDAVGFGNAVLSRWPISGTETLAYVTEPGTQEDRLALRVDIEGPRGPFQVFCTHLNWRLDHSGPRQDQVRQLAGFVAASRPREYPAVVCGDFNADPDSQEIMMMTGRAAVPVDKVVFHDAWECAGSGPGLTWDNTNPLAATSLERDRRIDYVFSGWPREGGAGQAVGCHRAGNEPIDGIWPSDHFAVVADLRY